MFDFFSQVTPPPVVPGTPGAIIVNVVGTLEAWTGQIVSALSAWLAGGTLTAIVVLAIVLYGYRLWFGWTETKLGDVTGKLFVLIFVIALSTVSALYFPILFRVFVQGPDDVVNVVLESLGVIQAPIDLLDVIWIEAFQAVTEIFTQAGWSDFSAYLLAVMIMVSSIVFVLVTFAIILMAKVATSVLIALTPIMLLALPFQTTRSLFEKWLGALFSYALIPIFAYMIVSLLMFTARAALTAGADGWSLQSILPYVAVCFIGFVVLLQANAIAATIGGGIGLAGAGALLAAGAGLGAALTRSGGRFASRAYDLAGGPRPARDRLEYQEQLRRSKNAARAADQLNRGRT